MGTNLLLPIQNRKGKFGYTNLNSQMVIKPQFDDAKEFHEMMYATVEINGKSGCINAKGEFIIPPVYDSIWWYENGYSIITQKDKKGYINDKGKIITELIFEDASEFYEWDLARVKFDGKYGFIDLNGKLTLFEDFDFVSELEENKKLVLVSKDGKYGFADFSGKNIVNPRFDDLSSFGTLGLAAAKVNDNYGFIDENGVFVIEPIYEEVANYEFNELGLALVKLNGKWGFINEKGQMVIENKYREASYFWRYPLTNVLGENGYWGCINLQGELIIEHNFKEEFTFHENGFAIVEIERHSEPKFGIINDAGDIVFPCEADDIWYYGDSYSFLKNDKFGFLDATCNIICEAIYDEVVHFKENGMARVLNGKEYSFIDKSGATIIKTDFEYVSEFMYGPEDEYAAVFEGELLIGYINTTGEKIGFF